MIKRQENDLSVIDSYGKYGIFLIFASYCDHISFFSG